MKVYKYFIGFLLMLLPLITPAQQPDKTDNSRKEEKVYVQNDQPEMADTFRKEGKIYVVVSVAAVILIGIFVYLFMLDRKVTKIEKQLKK